jgi:saccharopine dehydrogenase-like NADP-dependent oxidoreductase
MQQVLIAGAGKIGTLIAFLLANSGDYQVFLADTHVRDRQDLDALKEKSQHLDIVELDVTDEIAMGEFLKKNYLAAVISALPYFHNITLAKVAKIFNLHYFDLTEDILVAKTILELSHDATNAFVPQCGLAPGFISIVANQLMQNFPTLDTIKMRVGALPINVSNALQYSLTWSTDGLINEYGNMCHAIEHGQEVSLLPLDGLEEIEINGLTYEAFNTSGGIGTLAQSYLGKVDNMTYKTIRYPGHCSKIRFLMNDLKLNDDREMLKTIFERALPKTSQDLVLVYVSVTGMKNNVLTEENYVKKFYPKEINGLKWTAIQLTTACSLCAVFDLVMQNAADYRGFVRQEQFSLAQFAENRFGSYYAE